MKTVNNKERTLFNRGQHKKKKQEKDNKSKNAILLLLLIDGILIAYFYTLLDSDEIIPASDDQPATDDLTSYPDIEPEPDIVALYFLDLEGLHPPLPGDDDDSSLQTDLLITDKNRISTSEPPAQNNFLTTPPDPDVTASARPEIVSQSNPEPLPPDLVPEIDTSDPEIKVVVTETDISPEDEDRDVIFIDNDEGDLDPDDLVPEIDEILSVVLIPVASGGDDDGYIRPEQDKETPEDKGEIPSDQENTDNTDTRNNEEDEPGGNDETRPDGSAIDEADSEEPQEGEEDNELDGNNEEAGDNDPADTPDEDNIEDETDQTDHNPDEDIPEDISAPEITSDAAAPSLPENTEVAAGTAVYTATGTYDLTVITWSLSGTDDDGLPLGNRFKHRKANIGQRYREYR